LAGQKCLVRFPKSGRSLPEAAVVVFDVTQGAAAPFRAEMAASGVNFSVDKTRSIRKIPFSEYFGGLCDTSSKL
jgi:hypothetical protein